MDESYDIETNKHFIWNTVRILLVIILVTFIWIIVLVNFRDNTLPTVVTQIQCCDNKECTDTYYTPEDNKCHLVLCEHDLFSDKSQCTYEGANISIEYIQSKYGMVH